MQIIINSKEILAKNKLCDDDCGNDCYDCKCDTQEVSDGCTCFDYEPYDDCTMGA